MDSDYRYFRSHPVGFPPFFLLFVISLLIASCNGDDIQDLLQSEFGQGGSVSECAPTAVIGDSCGGGIVYSDNFLGAGIRLVAAPSDEGVFQWKTSLTSTNGSNDFDDGRNNTGTFNSTHPASFSCQNKIGSGYSDWYLPSGNEATPLASISGIIGGFTANNYWSSTQQTASWAAAVPVPTGGGVSINKTLFQPVRCIRRPI